MTPAALAILQAAAANGRDITLPDLVVAAWRRAPALYCLQGYPEYPNSNKVVAALSHRYGPVKQGYLERVGVGRYRLTAKGERAAKG